MPRLVLSIFIALISLMSVTGCSTVKPWEREYLADKTMQFEPYILEAEWHLHVREVLEGSRGGFSGSGGGCGCR